MRKNILILAANPKNTRSLRLAEELREIKEALQRSLKRKDFEVKQALAVRPKDVSRELLDFNAQVIHFSGHGEGDNGLFLENEIGEIAYVSGQALASLISLFEHVECVVLNACYSAVQAEMIAEHVPYVIGMSRDIGDKAAIEFARGFYDALAAGKDYLTAYKFGCSAIQMADIPEELTPVLKTKRPSKNAKVFISYRHQQPSSDLAQTLADALNQQGYQAFLDSDSIRWGSDWVKKINQEIEACDYFLLLISKDSEHSEMQLAELQQASELLQKHGKPQILPLRVDYPFTQALPYAFEALLKNLHQLLWQSPSDNDFIIKQLLNTISDNRLPT